MVNSAAADPRFTYARPDQAPLTRAVIRAIEIMGGERKLKKSYRAGQRMLGAQSDFFDMAVAALGLDVVYDPAALARIPKSGPVLFIANHPYGVLDGVTLTWLARKVRPDVKVMANGVLCAMPGAGDALLPVDFAPTPQAQQVTLETRIAAQAWLKSGNAIGIFPAGAVSTSQKPLKGPALDLPWSPFTAKLALGAKATVVPIYFEGQNSRLFQMASHLSLTLRQSLLFRETARRIGTEMVVHIGAPIPYEEWGAQRGREAIVAEFRRRTFALCRSDAERLAAPSLIQWGPARKPASATDSPLPALY